MLTVHEISPTLTAMNRWLTLKMPAVQYRFVIFTDKKDVWKSLSPNIVDKCLSSSSIADRVTKRSGVRVDFIIQYL